MNDPLEEFHQQLLGLRLQVLAAEAQPDFDVGAVHVQQAVASHAVKLVCDLIHSLNWEHGIEAPFLKIMEAFEAASRGRQPSLFSRAAVRGRPPVRGVVLGLRGRIVALQQLLQSHGEDEWVAAEWLFNEIGHDAMSRLRPMPRSASWQPPDAGTIKGWRDGFRQDAQGADHALRSGFTSMQAVIDGTEIGDIGAAREFAKASVRAVLVAVRDVLDADREDPAIF